MRNVVVGTLLPMFLSAVAGSFSPMAIANDEDHDDDSDRPCARHAARTVLYGRNNAADDVRAVQSAVDGGGQIHLRGTFDFGDSGRVLLTKDATICGEAREESRGPVTVIRRGEWIFYTPYPSVLPPTASGPKVAIHHIHFVEAKGTAIHLAYSGGASLRHNRIERMRVRQVNAVSERAAIVIGPNLLGGTPNTTFNPLLVSGDIAVADNYIDVSGPEATNTTRATGMFVSMYVGADVRIERNYVTGNTRTGLAILDGDFDQQGRGSVVIADNVVRTGVRVGFTVAGPRAPIGIVTGFNNQRNFGSDPNKAMIPVVIRDNTLELGTPATGDPVVPTPPMGIVNIWNGALIMRNSITVHGDKRSVSSRLNTSGGILATGSRQMLIANRFAGEGCNAIRIGGTMDGQERRDNFGIANDVSGFTVVGDFTKCAHLWFEPASHNNTFVGASGTVIDDGSNNSVVPF